MESEPFQAERRREQGLEVGVGRAGPETASAPVRVRVGQKPGPCRHGFEDKTEEFGQYLGSTREPGQGVEEGAVCHDLLFKQRFGQCPGKNPVAKYGRSAGRPR